MPDPHKLYHCAFSIEDVLQLMRRGVVDGDEAALVEMQRNGVGYVLFCPNLRSAGRDEKCDGHEYDHIRQEVPHVV